MLLHYVYQCAVSEVCIYQKYSSLWKLNDNHHHRLHSAMYWRIDIHAYVCAHGVQ